MWSATTRTGPSRCPRASSPDSCSCSACRRRGGSGPAGRGKRTAPGRPGPESDRRPRRYRGPRSSSVPGRTGSGPSPRRHRGDAPGPDTPSSAAPVPRRGARSSALELDLLGEAVARPERHHSVLVEGALGVVLEVDLHDRLARVPTGEVADLGDRDRLAVPGLLGTLEVDEVLRSLRVCRLSAHGFLLVAAR